MRLYFLTILHLLLSSSGEGEVTLDPDIVAKFSMLISKLNACVNHLEQFPIKVNWTFYRFYADFTMKTLNWLCPIKVLYLH